MRVSAQKNQTHGQQWPWFFSWNSLTRAWPDTVTNTLTLSLLSSKSTFSQPFKEKCVSEVVRICSIIIFHLSKLWKVKFSILCGVIFMVRLQGKFDIDHSSSNFPGSHKNATGSDLTATSSPDGRCSWFFPKLFLAFSWHWVNVFIQACLLGNGPQVIYLSNGNIYWPQTIKNNFCRVLYTPPDSFLQDFSINDWDNVSEGVSTINNQTHQAFLTLFLVAFVGTELRSWECEGRNIQKH